MSTRTHSTDIAIIGGGVGGCAAALAALEAGAKVILTEETAWIGGQLTSQAVPPDEHGWIERFGRTASYARFREAVRQHYRNNTALLPEVRANPRLNPGNGWVSPLCHEPKVALAVLEAFLAPYLQTGRLVILLHHTPLATEQDGTDRIKSVRLTDTTSGAEIRLSARMFLDATELGDLIALSGTESVTGRESRDQTGEPSAPIIAQPANHQAFSWCFALEYLDGANYVGTPPADYDYWRNYRPELTPSWPGNWLSWNGLNPRTMAPMHYQFAPHQEKLGMFSGLWTFRRIIDRSQFEPGTYASDLVMVNWPMIDYLGGDLVTANATQRTKLYNGARQLSLAVMHWLQTEAPRPDGGTGWPGLRLRPDVMGTEDGLAMAPYIRESRRIRAVTTIREQDVSAAHLPAGADRAREYPDSIGIGYYRIDLHPSCGGDNYIDVPSLPFQIPLGALIPVRMQNLLPAAKNIGTTHLTNGCYRLHPVEWNIGEVAGTLAAHCLRETLTPQAVQRDPGLISRFQSLLTARGIELAWPAEPLDPVEGDPHAHVMHLK
ncbi:MAG: FAD-dependent oxidoreductase [Cephaloticoccus sp.]|nr:FAD-dependent oxidoreductase [Cephaloticoccus sp.]MCF7759559.1 FAD-dependent oxidoreductase [Cephaloticoccus sp.]